VNRPSINPALGLDLVAERTLKRNYTSVSVVIPAHNEEETVAEVVAAARHGLELLGIDGEVLVSASGCTDNTADVAAQSGAEVLVTPIGKGVAITKGVAATTGDIVCLIDGDIRYFGERPLATILVEPILQGIADACITDLYWRPLYPQMWLYGFFAPVAGYLFPELLPKAGSTPWSGQRAAVRALWPTTLPDGFTADMEILLHWNREALRLRPVLADDWVNPQRPKPELMSQELDLMTRHAAEQGRITQESAAALRRWYEAAHRLMADYNPERDDPQAFEQELLRDSISELRRQLEMSTK
jgi:glycosyltransferase involved in cell wall biosynthesis